jgi:hypothetical protein
MLSLKKRVFWKVVGKNLSKNYTKVFLEKQIKWKQFNFLKGCCSIYNSKVIFKIKKKHVSDDNNISCCFFSRHATDF